MGNRAAISLIISSTVLIFAATLLPSFANAGVRDSIRDTVFKRICDRHQAISDRIGRTIGVPKFCEEPEPEPEPTPAPEVQIGADPETIEEGGDATLSWTATNATSCTASDGWSGSKSTSGSEDVAPNVTTTYHIECAGPGGTDSDEVTVTVTEAPEEPEAPTLIFTANPTTVEEGSDTNATSTLSWDSTHTTSCEASNGWSGVKSVDGSEVVEPTATTSITYVLTCTGDGGTITEEVTVTVVPETPAPILSFVASKLTVHENSLADATTTLTWNSTNTDSCTASGATEWTGVKSVDGEEILTPSEDVTYELECTGAGGNIHAEVTIDFVPEPVDGDLLITEVIYDLSTTTEDGEEPDHEWVEIYNGTGEEVDLSGYSIGDNNGDDAIPDGTILPAGTFAFIVGTSTTPAFWDIPAEAVIITLPTFIGGAGGLSNNDRIELRNTADELIDAVGWGTDAVAFGVESGLAVEANVSHSLGRTDINVDTDTAADWEEKDAATPGF